MVETRKSYDVLVVRTISRKSIDDSKNLDSRTNCKIYLYELKIGWRDAILSTKTKAED